VKLFENIESFLKKNKFLYWFLLVLLAGAGVALMIAVTPHGIGLVNDSVGYVAGARNMLGGLGYSRLTGDGSPRPITNYPPLFPIVLATMGITGLDAVPAALYLNIFLMGINVFLMGVTVRKVTRSTILSLLGAVMFLISSPVIRSHSFAMTEPLYLAFAFAMLLCLLKGIQSQQWYWIAISGLLASFAFLTRYVGISLYAAAVVAIFVLRPDPEKDEMAWGVKIKQSLFFLEAGFVFVAIWLGRNIRVSDSVGNRQFIFHPITRDKINEGLLNFWGWLLPERGGLVENLLGFWGVVFVLILLGLAGWAIIAAVRELQRKDNTLGVESSRFAWINTLQALSYLSVLLLSLMFFDASPIFEDRILLLFEVPLIVLAMAGLGWLWKRKVNWLRWAVLLVSAALLLSLSEDSLDAVKELRKDGQGFANSAVQESQVIAAAAELDDDVLLYSNRVTALYIIADKPAYVLPSPMNPATQGPREGYAEDVAIIREKALAGEGAIVFLNYSGLFDEPQDAAWVNDLTEGIPLYGEYDDGAIFGAID
jgi:4-amino-4-deoxy-L-arabinose transferase-like glycosyltransferase